MQLRQHKRRPVVVDITPLVDVVFLLLIFFMVSTSFVENSKLKLTLPDAGQAGSVMVEKQIIITVDANGALFINDKPVTRIELDNNLQKIVQQNKDMPIILRADSQAKHGDVVFILDTLSKNNLTHIGIATNPDSITDKKSN
ncbi:MAG: biopolymer transporter ExbD [Mariprofundales bacterium]